VAPPVTRSEFAAFLGRAAEACKETIAAYLETARPDLRFQRQALFTIAALEGCAARPEIEDADIRLVRTAASDGAGICRVEKPQASLIDAAHCLQGVVDACDHLLEADGARITGDWKRFGFAGADVEVKRRAHLWQVRAGNVEAQDKLLDVALGELFRLSDHRIGELTVQVLDWHAHEKLQHSD
jgi:hypothetical protein